MPQACYCVVGGNTYLLRKAMRLSGLGQLVHDKLNDEHFLYGVTVLEFAFLPLH